MSKKNNNGDEWKSGHTPTWGEIHKKVSRVDGINMGPLPQDTRENNAMQETWDKTNNEKTLMENVNFNEFSPPIPKDASEEHYESITKDFKEEK